MNTTTREASWNWWCNITEEQRQTYPMLSGREQLEELWIQKVVHPWFDGNRSHESFERKNKLSWHYFNISDFRLLTNEQRAMCYLKEQEVKEGESNLVPDGTLKLPGVFANHPRCAKDDDAAQKCLETLYSIKTGEYDPEGGHLCADEAICDLLTTLGYTEIVKAFNSLPKYYH